MHDIRATPRFKEVECLKHSTFCSAAFRRSGLMVSFGNASGAVPPVNIALMAQKGSLFLTRPTLVNYTATRADRYCSSVK